LDDVARAALTASDIRVPISLATALVRPELDTCSAITELAGTSTNLIRRAKVCSPLKPNM
jgi:hypothetical protein